MAPAMDLTLSQAAREREPWRALLPRRACVTTLAGMTAKEGEKARRDEISLRTAAGQGCGGTMPPRRRRGAPPCGAPHWPADSRALLEVLVDELRHLEHRDLALAAEDGLEVLVGVDLAAVLGVLETLPLDVRPQLLGDF